jgi:uncharacterized protein involved in type VI secretion and phage assembly
VGGNANNGIVIGVVSDLDDPEALGRVRVKFPHLAGAPSDWAKQAAPMAGKGRGFFFRHEPGDEVLVAFEQGDPSRPYILGALWSKEDTPPADDGQARKNNWRFIKSRSGHLIKLDDTDGAERVEVIDKDGNCRVVLDSAAKKVQVTCDQGDVEVTTGQGSVKVQATTVEIKASGEMTIEAQGALTIKGQVVNIN